MKKLGIIFTALVIVCGLTVFAANAAPISDARAKAIAAKHAGVPQNQAHFTKVELDRDDGRLEYEIEFYADGVEYEYEIDANSGRIIKFEQERKRFAPQRPGHNAQPAAPRGISAQRAKEIALSRVPGATERNIRKFEMDHDDGRRIYEIEIRHNHREYECEIDAETGRIISWEVDD